MRANTLIEAVRGLLEWRKYVATAHRNCLVCVVPEYDEELIEVFLDVLAKLTEDGVCNFTELRMIFCDCEVNIRMGQRNCTCVVIKEKQMQRLMSYIALTYKQYGAVWAQNVKVISRSATYGGQIQKMEEHGVCSLRALVKDLMIMRD